MKKTQQSKWDEIIEEFRALGGVADNIVLGKGDLGWGLFPRDTGQPSRIAVPENLLIDLEAVTFENGLLRIRQGATIPKRERAFFEFFENEFSWGAGGRSQCEAFIEAVDQLPLAVKEALNRDLGIELTDAANAQEIRAQTRFLDSRTITYQKRRKLMPVLELVNHGVNGCSFIFKNGVSIGGTFESEIFAHYGLFDPCGVFENFGFASAEQIAFSIPALLTIGSHRLVIRRRIDSSAAHGPFRVPVVEKEDDTFRMSFMMLGHERYPRLSKGIFYQLMADAGLQNAEAIFDEVRRFNIQKFLDLLEILEEPRGPLIDTLKMVSRYQISAMTHSIGTRKIAPS